MKITVQQVIVCLVYVLCISYDEIVMCVVHILLCT